MIGQEHLMGQLKKMESLDDIPKSIIITGQKGMGKHKFANDIATRFGFEYEIIDYELSLDLLNDMYALEIQTFYLIDFDSIKMNKRIERFQNTLLKFIEEPPEFAWVVIIASDIDSILETIKNRCQVYRLRAYSIDELRKISNIYSKYFDDDILRILHTPGNIVDYTKEEVDAVIKLSNQIIDSIANATPGNVLSLNKRFFGDNPLDIELFIMIFEEILFIRYNNEGYNNKYYNALLLSKEFQHTLGIMNVNKSYAFDHFILRLKLCMK